MGTIWTPHLTVAAVIEQEGKFLLVEEAPDGTRVLNQPAGHVEENESLLEAIEREVREEACRHFEPKALSGIYRWRNPQSSITYLRVAICGHASATDTKLFRDRDIIGEYWFSRDELAERPLRSTLVLRTIDDYLAGNRLPLDLITELK